MYLIMILDCLEGFELISLVKLDGCLIVRDYMQEHYLTLRPSFLQNHNCMVKHLGTETISATFIYDSNSHNVGTDILAAKEGTEETRPACLIVLMSVYFSYLISISIYLSHNSSNDDFFLLGFPEGAIFIVDIFGQWIEGTNSNDI